MPLTAGAAISDYRALIEAALPCAIQMITARLQILDLSGLIIEHYGPARRGCVLEPVETRRLGCQSPAGDNGSLELYNDYSQVGARITLLLRD